MGECPSQASLTGQTISEAPAAAKASVHPEAENSLKKPRHSEKRSWKNFL